MNKYLYLNKSNVIIDIVDDVKPVMRNVNQLVVLCDTSEAQGYIGSDNNTIYAKDGTQLIPSFTDISHMVMVSEIPDGVKPLQYKYDDGEFVENTDDYPLDILTLTIENRNLKQEMTQTQLAVVEAYEMMLTM